MGDSGDRGAPFQLPPEMYPGNMACQDGSPEKAHCHQCTTYDTDSTPEIGPSNFPATVYTRRVLSAVCLFHGLHTYTYTEFQKMAAGIRPTDLYRPLDSLLHILLLVFISPITFTLIVHYLPIFPQLYLYKSRPVL